MLYENKKLILLIFLLCILMNSVQIEFADENSQNEWLVVKGDLHCHSNFSGDSTARLERVIQYSVENGYDFIALTEHNTLRHLKEDHSTENLIVLPGYEWTLGSVHINLYGLRSFHQKTFLYDREYVAEYLDYIHELGGYASVCHPNDPKYGIKIGYDIPIDFMEVWNRNFLEDDKESLKDWHNLLVQGRKIYAIGGSDEHNYEQVERGPFNNVFVKEKTADEILKNLKKGHNYISLTKDGPEIQFFCEEALMGDTVKYSSDKLLTIKIVKAAPASLVRVYSDKGLEFEEKVVDIQNNDYFYSKEWPMEKRMFYRVEVWLTPNQIAGISNPIFIEN